MCVLIFSFLLIAKTLHTVDGLSTYEISTKNIPESLSNLATTTTNLFPIKFHVLIYFTTVEGLPPMNCSSGQLKPFDKNLSLTQNYCICEGNLLEYEYSFSEGFQSKIYDKLVGPQK